MKNTLLHILVLFTVIQSYSQIHEIGIFAGGTNYIGDVGSTNYINPTKPAFGLIYKWNRSTRHAWRFSYYQGKITANDSDSEAPNRNLRGYSIENNIREISAGLEFNFLDFDLHSSYKVFSPYVYTGITAAIYNETYLLSKTNDLDYQFYTFAIPMTVGIKTKISNHLVLGLETGARYTFTDNLDGSNPRNKNFESLKFGNLNNKDWYVFTGFTLTYTFGQNPCFCAK